MPGNKKQPEGVERFSGKALLLSGVLENSDFPD
jgi:hypothetical protein